MPDLTSLQMITTIAATQQPLTLQDMLGIANVIILFLTGIVVCFYTREAQRSNEIQEEPLINLSFKDTTRGAMMQSDGEIFVKNIGKGPAYNITLERFIVAGYSYRFYLKTPFLEANQERLLDAVIRTPDDGTEYFGSSGMKWFLSRLVQAKFDPKTIEEAKENPAIFVVHCTGINGKIYHYAFALYSDLPPVGDMVVQFVTKGRGKLSIEDAKMTWRDSEKIVSCVVD